MGNTNRTFRKQTTIKEVDWTTAIIKEWDNSKKREQWVTVKDSRLPYQLLFEDADFVNYFTATLMLGNFLGVKAPICNGETDYVVDERELKLTFNTAYSIIQYFKLRYKNHPELVKRFVEARLTLSPYNFITLIRIIEEINNKTPRIILNKEFKTISEDWEFLHKVTLELTSLERIGNPRDNTLLYQLLHYYYYGNLMVIPVDPMDTTPF